MTELKLLKPAGAMLIVLPIELLTDWIFWLTAWRAISIVKARPMLSPSITTIDTARIEFRKTFLKPREITFIVMFLLLALIYVGLLKIDLRKRVYRALGSLSAYDALM